MAITLDTLFPGKVAPANADYPYGSARNITTPGDNTGTPWDEDLINDWLGFFQSLLVSGGITPNGLPDKVGASQYMQALNNLSSTGTGYCPGYSFNFINTTSFSVVGFDVTNLIHVGKRLSFTDGANIYHGTVTNSVFGTDTTITMTMEGADVLTATISEFCLVSGTAGWSPIAGDPFQGTAINSVVSGFIGATKYWVFAGDDGKIGISTDAGVTLTMIASGTVEHLNQVDYDSVGQKFMIAGNAGVILYSTAPDTAWTLNTASILALTTTGTGDCKSIALDPKTQHWSVIYQKTVGHVTANSIDGGVSWSDGGSFGTSVTGKMAIKQTVALANESIIHGTGEDVHEITDSSDTTWSAVVDTTGESNVSGIISFVRNLTDHIMIGRSNGDIFDNTASRDTTSFGASSVNAFAYSPLHERLIAVGDSGKIGFISGLAIDAGTLDLYNLVSNGANPLSNFLDAHWDEDDGVFLAVTNLGEILRSTNGIN